MRDLRLGLISGLLVGASALSVGCSGEAPADDSSSSDAAKLVCGETVYPYDELSGVYEIALDTSNRFAPRGTLKLFGGEFRKSTNSYGYEETHSFVHYAISIVEPSGSTSDQSSARLHEFEGEAEVQPGGIEGPDATGGVVTLIDHDEFGGDIVIDVQIVVGEPRANDVVVTVPGENALGEPTFALHRKVGNTSGQGGLYDFQAPSGITLNHAYAMRVGAPECDGESRAIDIDMLKDGRRIGGGQATLSAAGNSASATLTTSSGTALCTYTVRFDAYGADVRATPAPGQGESACDSWFGGAQLSGLFADAAPRTAPTSSSGGSASRR